MTEAPATVIAEIAQWPLNRHGEFVRVALEQFKGVDLVNIRKWYLDDNEALRPGKGGIALNVKHLPQLADALTKALAQARVEGLVDDGGPAGGAGERDAVP
jgi:transcriptional coactivator p15 (PC4)